MHKCYDHKSPTKYAECKGWSIFLYVFSKSEQCSDLGGWVGYKKLAVRILEGNIVRILKIRTQKWTVPNKCCIMKSSLDQSRSQSMKTQSPSLSVPQSCE